MRGLARAFALLGLAASATAAQGAVLEEFNVQGWIVGAYSDDRTGQFSHCATSVPYKSGISLLFHLTRTYQWSMGLVNPKWRHTPGQTFNLIYRIDNGPRTPVRGIVAATGMVSIPLADSRALFENFRRGNKLYVLDSKETFTFNLTNSSKALDATLQCVQRYNRSGPTTPYPPPSSGPPPSGGPAGPAQPYPTLPPPGSQPTAPPPLPPSPPPIPDRAPPKSPGSQDSAFQGEAATLAANVLSGSGIAGVRVLQRDQIAPESQRFDAVWTTDAGLFGTLTVVVSQYAATVDQVVADLTAADAQDCMGSFSSGRYPTDDASGAGRLVTLCTGASFPEVQYTIVRRSTGGFYVFGVTGNGVSSGAVLDAGTKLYDGALKTVAPG